MSEVPPQKTRRLRAAPQTMRERAERSANPKPNTNGFARIGRMFRLPAKLHGLKIWQPVRSTGRFIARFFIPPYVRNSFGELRMVMWPTRRQSLQLTGAVIIFSAVFGVVVALFDYGLDKLFKQVILR